MTWWAFAIMPALLVGAGVVLGPPMADLIRRPEAVGMSWALPAAGWALVCGTLGVGMVASDPLEPTMAERAGALFVVFLGGLSGILLAMGWPLAFVRGLRPGAPTTRRWRTTAAVLAVTVGFVGISALAAVDLALLPWLWPAPWIWTACVWAIGLDRDGPPRLANARRAGALWLWGSLLTLGAAAVTALLLVRVAHPPPGGPPFPRHVEWAGVVPFVGMSAGATALAWHPRAMAASVAGCLGAMLALGTAQAGLDGWYRSTLPAWVDLAGAPPNGRRTVGTSGACRVDGWDTPCDTRPRVLFAPRTLPARDVPAGLPIAVDGGHRAVPIATQDARTTRSVVVRDAGGGRFDVDDAHGLDRAEAHALLRTRYHGVVLIADPGDWDLQTALSVCASVPDRQACAFAWPR